VSSQGNGGSAPITAGPTLPPGFGPSDSAGTYGAYGQQPDYYGSSSYGQVGGPVIQNPFPHPNQAGRGGLDPDQEAQYQQWQSTYNTKDDAASKAGGKAIQSVATSRTATGTLTPLSGVDSTIAGNEGPAAAAKPKTVIRSGGGKTWEDETLTDWDPSCFRLFVGNLAGEVTDDSLFKAFSKYTSLQRTRVLRDKRTTKSKGYGFVEFRDGDDYFKAAKEMQGKYIGSHPVVIKPSNTPVEPVAKRDNHKFHKNKHRKNKGGFNQGHANTGSGVKKPKSDKGGMNILG
jgi:hypothetical protein